MKSSLMSRCSVKCVCLLPHNLSHWGICRSLSANVPTLRFQRAPFHNFAGPSNVTPKISSTFSNDDPSPLTPYDDHDHPRTNREQRQEQTAFSISMPTTSPSCGPTARARSAREARRPSLSPRDDKWSPYSPELRSVPASAEGRCSL
jgi:hypothetical protein